MLIVPTGQVLVSDGASIFVYTDSGAPLDAWRPTITAVPSSLARSGAYTVSGKQLNGLTQACAYGDDNQQATNYPLVRITNTATSHVSYARTSGMTSMSVTPGATSSANFKIPAAAELGPSTLQVVANGIASSPVNVTVTQPVASSRSSRIVFSSDRGGNSDIYSMNPNGSGVVNLTNNASSDIEPVLSPDGTKIAFVTNRSGNSDVYVMNSDGTNAAQFTTNTSVDEFPAWSPDSKALVWDSNRDGDYEIFKANLDKTGLLQLTTNTGSTNDPPGPRTARRSRSTPTSTATTTSTRCRRPERTSRT